ncbi:hypothetical protein GUJ93_ZPchr0014g47179 [Zizania palustris]|uniref:Uncharacterized protein n=1 Tax=Zizania palustris TaxID=103762 RepID=A0A8J5TER5_ZIZPA|nr:hypothetical protein GUJ93_ZPchr0014g47179 [Zizania palustris]
MQVSSRGASAIGRCARGRGGGSKLGKGEFVAVSMDKVEGGDDLTGEEMDLAGEAEGRAGILGGFGDDFVGAAEEERLWFSEGVGLGAGLRGRGGVVGLGGVGGCERQFKRDVERVRVCVHVRPSQPLPCLFRSLHVSLLLVLLPPSQAD